MKSRNIYKRQDGRFEGRIYNKKNPNGKRSYKSFLGKTWEQVQELMSAFLGECVEESDCLRLFSDVFLEWLGIHKHNIKESTLSNYRTKANKHILPFFGDKKVTEIEVKDFYAFVELKQKEGLSHRYIEDIVRLTGSAFKYIVRTYHISNPMDGFKFTSKKAPEIKLLDESEKKLLQKYISENHNRTTMGIALTTSTGLRIGELCGLQWADIDLDKRILTVRKTVQRIQCQNGDKKTKIIITDPKTESSKRTIPLNRSMVDFLKEFKENDEEFVMTGTNKPLEPRTMQYRFVKILKLLNLPLIHFHALRHMFATSCIKLNFDVKTVSELLGHSKVEITLNRYVHSSFEQKREYMERLDFNF